jgi:internalin A
MKKNYLETIFLLATSCLVYNFVVLFYKNYEGHAQTINTFRTFEDWCKSKDSLDKETMHTVNELLLLANTSDCRLANKELSSYTRLYLQKRGISSLLPLSGFTNLTELNLAYNKIVNIKPLEKLTKMTELAIGYNQITDITPLRNMRSLNKLSAGNNQISDVTPLQSLTKLQFLFLNNNKITDISSLHSLINVKYTSFRGNPIINETCPFININYEDKIEGNPCRL